VTRGRCGLGIEKGLSRRKEEGLTKRRERAVRVITQRREEGDGITIQDPNALRRLRSSAELLDPRNE